MTTSRIISYADAVNEAVSQAMDCDSNVICYGLGVADPKGVFGTTLGLKEKFGESRVFDMPTSENAMTGVAVGASLNGIRPVMVHQRLDFFLLAMDQLVNNAAKWSYMFGGHTSVPITIRLIVGRGWGQGPTHSQSLHSWFAHIPGLKVVLPTFPNDAKGLLMAAISDDNPVLVIEHRWLHSQLGEVKCRPFRLSLEKARVVRDGDDLTIVALSYTVIEALRAVDCLKQYGVTCELIDLRSVNPIDWQTIKSSIKKTGKLLVVDPAHVTCSVASEIISRIVVENFHDLSMAPQRIGFPDLPTPTSSYLSKDYYPGVNDIVERIAQILNLKTALQLTQGACPQDVSGDWFVGPF